jgi:UDP-glucose:(heptosyl)LPS alpha-1,3-glucosyltransferase
MAFLFVGYMRKGAGVCLHALSKTPMGKLLFVSRGPDAPFRALADRLGISERVRFLGMSTKVERYYAAADAFLLPTHYDSFGLVVTEAMASALPVITSKEAGAAELIQSGVDGIVLEDYTDSGELAHKMSLLAGNRALATQLGTAARQTVEQRSWDVSALQTMQVYRQLLAERGNCANTTTYSVQS